MPKPRLSHPLPQSARPHPTWRARLLLLRAAVAAALVMAVTLTGAATASARIIGPDVSSHNHDNRSRVSWRIMHTVGGASFVFIKATEGRDYHNPNFARDFAASRRHKLYRGAYHYARPGGRDSSQIMAGATAEADFFIGVTGTLTGPGNLPPVLDLEDAGNLSPAHLTLWCRTWLGRVKALTGRTPILYTYGFFWRQHLRNSRHFAAYPLWLASYGVAIPARVGGWHKYTFWQYTESGRMAGAGGPVDLSVFNGSKRQLAAMSSKRSAPSKKLGEPATVPRPLRPLRPVRHLKTLTTAASSEPVTSGTPARPKNPAPPGNPAAPTTDSWLTLNRLRPPGSLAAAPQTPTPSAEVAPYPPGPGFPGVFRMDGTQVFGGS